MSLEGRKQGRIATFLQKVDWPLVIIVTLLASVGIVNLYSASIAAERSYHIAQAIAYVFGLGGALVMGVVDRRIFEKWSYVFYGVVVALLVLVMVAGKEINGSKRWLDLGVFLLQPSELLKIAVILITARFFKDRPQPEGGYSLMELGRLFGMVALGVVFVLKQPDLGTSLTILVLFMTMVLFEGVRVTSLIAMGMAVMVALPFVWSFGMKEYQKDRVITFLNLEEDQYGQAWQVRQSIIAFGSGRVWGKGFVEGTQIQKGFVPEHENDFAAANWGEEHGFVGMVLLLALYMALIIWALRIASRAPDRYGVHVGVGMAAFFFWHVLVNLGMVSGMLPVVGLPLPLMSYGRSNLMTVMLGVGFLLNTSAARKGHAPR